MAWELRSDDTWWVPNNAGLVYLGNNSWNQPGTGGHTLYPDGYAEQTTVSRVKLTYDWSGVFDLSPAGITVTVGSVDYNVPVTVANSGIPIIINVYPPGNVNSITLSHDFAGYYATLAIFRDFYIERFTGTVSRLYKVDAFDSFLVEVSSVPPQVNRPPPYDPLNPFGGGGTSVGSSAFPGGGSHNNTNTNNNNQDNEDEDLSTSNPITMEELLKKIRRANATGIQY